MTHEAHPDIHEHGLADGCAACSRAAEEPLSFLDSVALRQLIERTLRDRFPETFGEELPGGGATTFAVSARSANEGIAMAKILTAMEQAGKLAEVDPVSLVEYIRARWRVLLRLEHGEPSL